MIKIGVLGCGFMGGTHLSAYTQLQGKDVVVTAVTDLISENAQKFAAALGAKVYANAEELLANADINTVDICLPTYLHYKYACDALNKGYNVFVEKPLCRTAEEAKELAALASKKGVVAMVGQVLRFWDEYVFLKNAIQNKTYGEVINANFRRLSTRPVWGWENWLMDYGRSGGAALDLHIHDTDFMLYAFGEPQKIKTITNKNENDKNSYILTIADYGKFTVSLEGCWSLPKDFPFQMTFRVIFEKAVVDFTPEGLKVYNDEGVTVPQLKKENTSKSENLGGNISDLGGYYNELVYFVKCLKENKKAERATLEDGAKAVAFVEKELGAII